MFDKTINNSLLKIYSEIFFSFEKVYIMAVEDDGMIELLALRF